MNSEKTLTGSHDGQNLRVGVVTATFNLEITAELEKGALAQLQKLGVKAENIISVRVPGAFEVPLAAQVLFETHRLDGVIALGAVIRGETSHYDYVCEAAERGCSGVALKFAKPVVFGILTTENDEQALDRIGGRHGHKGIDAATAVVEMCNLLKALHESGAALDAEGQGSYNLGLSKEVSP